MCYNCKAWTLATVKMLRNCEKLLLYEEGVRYWYYCRRSLALSPRQKILLYFYVERKWLIGRSIDRFDWLVGWLANFQPIGHAHPTKGGLSSPREGRRSLKINHSREIRQKKAQITHILVFYRDSTVYSSIIVL